MSSRPLVGAAVAFAAGVALGAWLPQHPAAAATTCAAALLAWAMVLGRGSLRPRESLGGCAGLAALALAGVVRCQTALVPLYGPVSAPSEGEAVVAGRVAGPAAHRGGDQSVLLDGVRIRRDNATALLAKPVRLVLERTEDRLRIGDLLTVRGRLALPRGDRNLSWFPMPPAPAGGRTAASVFVFSPYWVRRDGHREERGPGAAVLRWREAASAFWREKAGPAAAICDALTTGERAEIPTEVQDAFRRSGLTHLLAISGMNVGFLAALVYLILRRVFASWEALALRFAVQPIAAAATLPFLWFFYRFSGSQVPVGRATLMTAAGMAAILLWRRMEAVDALALAGFGILVADPLSLFSISFQLSFAAVVALALVAPRIATAPEGGETRCERIVRGCRNLLVVSLAAGGMTAPLVAFHFQQVALVGPVANLVAVPFTGLLALPSAWSAIVLGALPEPLGGALGDAARLAAVGLSSVLVDLATFFAAPPWSSVRTPRPPPLLTFALTAVAATLIAPAARTLGRRRVAALGAVAVASAWWVAALHRDELRVVFFDVGQGMSTAALLPGGATLVVDGGPRWREGDAGARVVAPALRRLGVRRLDALALTHLHPDHAGGIRSLLEEFPTGALWHAAGSTDAVAAELGGARSPLRRGGPAVRELALGETAGLPRDVLVRIVNPPREEADGAHGGGGEANERSLAFLLRWRGAGVLMTGDAGPRIAVEAAAALGRHHGVAPGSLVVQAPHHGASPEACRALAEAVRPSVAVIPVGRNTYGHPRPGAVATLERTARVLRTDREGAVFLRSRGAAFEVRTWRDLAFARRWSERVRWLVEGW